MPHVPSNYVHHGPWDDEVKIEARYKTIIDIYRKIFKSDSIPKDKQYWTMCGAHYKNDGPLKGELGCLDESKLIDPTQFYGIDREEKIIEINKNYYPHIKWIHGDFVDIINKYINKNQFKPSIVNYDGIMQPKYGVDYLKKIIMTIDGSVPDKLLLIANFVITNPYNRSKELVFNLEDIVKRLMKIHWLQDQWNIIRKGFFYKHNSTTMGTIVFVKDPHKIGEFKYTKTKNNYIDY
jgi:hypothetical protein